MIDIAIYIVLGIIGAGLRIALQVKRDKKLTQSNTELLCEFFIGGVAGFIAYRYVLMYGLPNHLLSIIAGYFAPDAIEMLLKDKKPFSIKR